MARRAQYHFCVSEIKLTDFINLKKITTAKVCTEDEVLYVKHAFSVNKNNPRVIKAEKKCLL